MSKPQRVERSPRRVVERVLLLAAFVTLLGLLLLHATLFGTNVDSLKLLVPGVTASVVTLLGVYIVTRTLLRDTQDFLSHEDVSAISEDLVEAVEQRLAAATNSAVTVHGWYELPWHQILADAQRLEVAVSYMDTWINDVGADLKAILERGGRIVLYLPAAGTAAGERAQERFPEYAPEILAAKIANTPAKIQSLGASPTAGKGIIEVGWTKTFNMWCLVRVDARTLVVSPYDHFRQGRIENPSFLIDLELDPRWASWADKEFAGFRATSTSVERLPARRAARRSPASGR